MVIRGNVSIGGRQVSGAVERAENIYIKELYFENRYNFPNIGRGNILYIAIDEKDLTIGELQNKRNLKFSFIISANRIYNQNLFYWKLLVHNLPSSFSNG